MNKLWGKLNKKVIVAIGLVLVAFVVLNIAILAVIIPKEIKGKPYPEARKFMVSAEFVNMVYIIPLSQVFGWENPATLPFYWTRDSLYNKGMSLFPADEGEREIWWQDIKELEYMAVVDRQFTDFDLYGKKFSEKQINKFEKWINERYDHLKPLATLKIKNPEYRKQRLERFLQTAIYVSMNYRNVCQDLKARRYTPTLQMPVPLDDEQLKKIEDLYFLYEDLKTYSKEHEKDSYEYFLKIKRHQDLELRLQLASYVIETKFVENKLTCDDPFLKIFAETQKEILDYRRKHRKELSSGEINVIQMLAVQEVVSKDHSVVLENALNYCPVLKNYVEFYKNYTSFSKENPNGD